MKYRLVIFDCDGTLADTLPWARSQFNELARRHGFREVQDAEHDRLRDLTGLELLRELKVPLRKLPAIVNGMRRLMAEHGDQFQLFPGISEMLERLQAGGAQLAVVSSNSAENVQRVLGPANASRISYYACGASMFGKAPKLRRVVRLAKLSPAHAIYVGDEIRDGEAAAAVGMAFGAVSWGLHSEQGLLKQRPAFYFTAVQEIAERIVGETAPVSRAG